MPERDALTVDLGDGYELVAAGVRREKGGDLTADLILRNGDVLAAERCVLNSSGARLAWCEAAAQAVREGGPTAFRMATAIAQHVMPQALGQLQEAPKKQPSQSDELVRLLEAFGAPDITADAVNDAELFHTPDRLAYATVKVGTHLETWELRSPTFRHWLSRRYYEKNGATPKAQSLTDAIATLTGKALFDGPEHPVYVRVAQHRGGVYLDLCDEGWRCVEIKAHGWRVIADPPVKFRRTGGMLALPVPIEGGRLDALKGLLNLPREKRADGGDGDGPDPDAWRLTAGWLVGALHPSGPYPLLALHGEQGSGKSLFQRILRGLIDPNKADLRTLPGKEDDLMISASNAWCLAFDNLSHLKDWQSDALCRIATGGGLAKRELWTNADETILDARRPVLLNGIEEAATRGDLLDRTIVQTLPTMRKARRRSERRLLAEFRAARPKLLGALLDAVAAALANESDADPDDLPRMADHVVWVEAAAPALGWKPGEYLAAYNANRDVANEVALSASPVGGAVLAWAQDLPERWSGTAQDLLAILDAAASEKVKNTESLPKTARGLSGAMRRLAPNLRAAGVGVTLDVREPGSGKRLILIDPPDGTGGPEPSRPSRPPRDDEKPHDGGDLWGDGGDGGPRTDRHDRRGEPSQAAPGRDGVALGVTVGGTPTVTENPRTGAERDGRDGRDGRAPVCVECGDALPPGWTAFYCAEHGGRPPDEADDGDDWGDDPEAD